MEIQQGARSKLQNPKDNLTSAHGSTNFKWFASPTAIALSVY